MIWMQVLLRLEAVLSPRLARAFVAGAAFAHLLHTYPERQAEIIAVFGLGGVGEGVLALVRKRTRGATPEDAGAGDE